MLTEMLDEQALGMVVAKHRYDQELWMTLDL